MIAETIKELERLATAVERKKQAESQAFTTVGNAADSPEEVDNRFTDALGLH
jgi:hypothetical protein